MPTAIGFAPEEREVKVFRNDLRDIGVDISDGTARTLLFLAERKFNRYDPYAPGETFQQRLVEWLSNFEAADRKTAMEIVAELRFFNQSEMRSLAAATLYDVVNVIQGEDLAVSRASAASFVETIQSQTEAALSKSLFVAMADDVMFDFFRRNAQRLFPGLLRGNFVEYYKLSPESIDLVEHSRIFLLDQFSGSSRSFLRKEEDEWKGKLPTFCETWKQDLLESGAKVYYAPYIMSTVAQRALSGNLGAWIRPEALRTQIGVIPTQIVPVAGCMSSDGGVSVDDTTQVSLLCDKYYVRFKENVHTMVGGGCKHGFGAAGLVLVMYTNCPNDSLYLIWHGYNDWKPLFPRVEHHRE